MSKEIKIDFAKVNFHIKEFQKVYILENCKLYFYTPTHLQSKDKDNGKTFKDKDEKIHQEQQIIKTKAQSNEKADINEEQAKTYAQQINKELEELKEDNFTSKIQTQTIKQRQDNFKDYDIFYDVYTSKPIQSLNEELGYEGFKVKEGIAEVKAEFFNQCFKEGKYVLIPRLTPLNKDESLHFDPVPLEDKGFVVTDFRKGRKEEKNIDLNFQRTIAKIENPNLTLQTPKEFLQALNENEEFKEENKEEQAKAIQEACEIKVEEMSKILLNEDKNLKDVIKDDTKLKKAINDLRTKSDKSPKELSLLGRLEFLQKNQKKIEDYKGIIRQLQNPQATSDSNKDNSNIKDDSNKNNTKDNSNIKDKDSNINNDTKDSNKDNSNIKDNDKKDNNIKKKNTTEQKTINSKDIGDAGEYAASMLFVRRSTRYLSNRRKIDANFNIHGFNHTIPDFLITLNGYPALVEVKNVKVQSLTEQISFELKLAREYELDYLFICNHYTKLEDNITHLPIFNKDNKDHKGSRSGFIYHRHAHRSIKTIFKEIYLHHIKGSAPNKIIIKRLNLNDPANIEEQLNKNKHLQKN